MASLEYARIESTVLSAIERVENGAKVEDARLELKQDWIDAKKAARRIAGHLNAAHGSEVIWVIGVDEDKGVIGTSRSELADWWAQVCAQFDGLAPHIIDLAINVRNKEVCVLVLGTDRAPFVIKNPVHGKEGSGPVSLEVPFRDGTAVRSASRNDLLKILVPLADKPDLEVLDGYFVVKPIHDGVVSENKFRGYELFSRLSMYLSSSSGKNIAFPFHRCSGWVGPSPEDRNGVSLKISASVEDTSRTDIAHLNGNSVICTAKELIVKGFGSFDLRADAETSKMPSWYRSTDLFVCLSLGYVGSKEPLDLRLKFRIDGALSEFDAHWRIASDD